MNYSLFPDYIRTRSSVYALFVQDDIRVSRKLTLNVGLRWDAPLWYHEVHNRSGVFDLNKGQYQVFGQDGFRDTPWKNNWKNFGPRLGFAYTPTANSRLVVRGGFGMFAAGTLSSGASGFLPKTVSLETLPRAVRAAAAGEAVVTRRLTAELIDRLRRSSPDGTGLRPVRSELTSREWEVLDLLCRQLSTDEIADTLVLSHETVRSHVKNILRKLGVRSRKEAIEVARELRSGIVKNGKEAA